MLVRWIVARVVSRRTFSAYNPVHLASSMLVVVAVYKVRKALQPSSTDVWDGWRIDDVVAIVADATSTVRWVDF